MPDSSTPDLCETCQKIKVPREQVAMRYHNQYSSFWALQASAESGCPLCLILWQQVMYCTKSLKNGPNLGYSDMPLRLVAAPDRLSLEVQHFRLYVKWEVPYVNDLLNTDFVQRSIAPFADDKSVWNLARQWLDSCDEYHTCHPYKSEGPLLPTRVVDVGLNEDTPHLHRSKPGERGRYLALSYCWGTDPISAATKSTNVDQFHDRIPTHELPKTLQDAFTAARCLEVRYVWIDSLCIIQDDLDDWKSQSARMTEVFQHAYCTIAALVATRAKDGFLCYREASRLIAPSSCLVDERYAIAEAPRWDHHVEHSPMTSRAWIVQEMALSSRILYFTDTGLCWQCRTSWATECDELCTARQVYKLKQHSGHRQPSKDLKDNYDIGGLRELRTLSLIARSPISILRTRKAINEILFSNLSTAELNSYWRILVDNYSPKELSRTSDRLIAISGLANAVRLKSGDQYLGGLWKSSICEDLAWSSWEPQRKDSDPRRLDSSKFPSWSWASLYTRTYYKAYFNAPDPTKTKVKPLACLLGWNVSLAGSDPCGPITSSRLTLSVELLELSAEKTAELKIKNPSLSLTLDTENGPSTQEESYLHTLDFNLDETPKTFNEVCNLHLAAITTNDTPWDFATVKCLLLAPCEGSGNHFRRIGLATFQQVRPDLGSSKADMDFVKAAQNVLKGHCFETKTIVLV